MNEVRNALLPGATAHEELTAPFWKGCEEGELRVQQCQDCKTRFFTPLPACPSCLSRDWSWTTSPGTGTLYSFTVVSYLPGAARPVPYILAIVDLDDGWTITSNLVDCGLDEARCGLRVHVCFVKDQEGRVLPQFAPLTEPMGPA